MQPINIGKTTTLSATGAVTYVWNPIDQLSCSTCSNTSVSPYVTTQYIVTGTDVHGCENTDTVTVQVDYICGDFFVPNVFSPNGDGKNDFVNAHGACILTYYLQIFDRWGEKVFETIDPDYSWDGTFRGKPLDTGVFVYQVTGTTRANTPFLIKGNITLLR